MKKKRGQVLLITVMLLATALTVILSVSFKSTTDTQLTKLEEESQKALAAAEAGIEAALKQGTIANIGSLPGLGDFTGSASIETTTTNSFITPLLLKDEQYTFYLANYTSPNNFSNYWSGNLTICFGNVALEITLIKSDNTLTRYAVNPSNSSIINNGVSASSGSNNCPESSFSNNYSLASISNTKLMIARVIGGQTKIGIKGSSVLPLQGKTIVSEAKSKTGVTKKVILFQSYPQIPANFFVTSF